MRAKRNQLAPKIVESLIVIKENMAMVNNFLKSDGYEIEKSENNSNPFEKINIEGQKRHDAPKDIFNGERDTEKEDDII